MPELFLVGFFAASGGYMLTSLSVAIRKMLNPKAKQGGAEVSALQIAKISAAVGTYVAVSSNLRYQVVKRCGFLGFGRTT